MTDKTESQVPEEQMNFEAEVSQLMQLMIHSLYSNLKYFFASLFLTALMRAISAL